MFIETSANFYLPGEGSNNRQGSDERVGGSVRVNTYSVDWWSGHLYKNPIHFLLPGEGGEQTWPSWWLKGGGGGSVRLSTSNLDMYI